MGRDSSLLSSSEECEFLFYQAVQLLAHHSNFRFDFMPC